MPSPLPPLIPARILNEHVYCRRLAYLEWVDQQFTDNAYTAEGSFVHRNVDRERARPPEPKPSPPEPDGDAGGESQATRSAPVSTAVTVSSERLGLIAKVDLLEAGDGAVVPVEYKRGSPRSAGAPLWEPELVQLCAQVLILRDLGYDVPHAEVFFAQSRTRHVVHITDELIEKTTDAVATLRDDAGRDHPPPPLADSPKCPHCSLVGICLPDEVNALREQPARPPRRLVASDPQSTPLYATTPGSHLTKRGQRAVLIEDGKPAASRRLLDVSHIAVFGNVDVASPLLRTCFDAGIPVLWFTMGGWFKGFATGMPPKNVEVRMRQHRAAALGSPELASAFVNGKIRNCRTMLRRHIAQREPRILGQLSSLAAAAEAERSLESLLGIEGTAARIYFSCFGALLKSPPSAFCFEERNRRPPKDPVNALLSFVYAMLVKDVTVALLAAGLDPHVGVYHRPGFGRPALALDLAEEFRPLIGDSTVMMAINNGEISERDFVSRAGGVSLTDSGRRKAIAAYERRMTSELTHPIFRYKASYRRSLEIQARLLAAVLVGDTPTYRSLTTR
ncbi:MAG: CRISPR-associated endonuclease Cas4g/Cas1g [Solirubrobacteraceae bacterium]